MTQRNRCPQCGTELTPDTPLGLCPLCLLKAGLAAPDSLRGDTDAATSLSPSQGGLATALPHDVGNGRRATSGDEAGEAPAHVGPYTVLGVLGEGGMGIVYLAEQTTPIHRRVALKLVKPGMDSREVLRRFDAERQALALMDHPHIARVLDAGLGPGGRPYFVMEYVPGLTITDYCDRHRLSNTERLALFLPICAAIQHAHQKGVIHRDLKPSNILVAVADGKPVPKVIDFGIAKATHQGGAERAAFTELGRLIGTPEYMSPEQAEASGLEVDTTTDIYALGVVLYELLVGALPFDPVALRQAGYAEIHRIIREQEPPKPSTRASTLGATAEEVAKRRQTTPMGLTRQVRGDLDAIAMKAMEKDRTRRYASASEFAADIERYLRGDAVVARPASVAYRTKKFVRRHKVGVAAGALVVAALVVGIVVSTLFYVRAEGARAEADVARRDAERQAYSATLSSADLSIEAGQDYVARERLLKIPPARRQWEWQYLFHKLDSSLTTLFAFGSFHWFPSTASSFTFSSDGTRLYWNTDTTVHDWDTRTWLRGETRGGFGNVYALSPHGEYVLARGPVGAGEPGLRIVEPATGRVVSVLAQLKNAVVTPAAFSRDGGRVAVGGANGEVSVWDCRTGQRLTLLKGSPGTVWAVAFSPDSGALASSGDDKVIRVWDLPSGRLRHALVGHMSIVRALAFSSDGRWLASGSDDRTIHLWDAASGQSRHVLQGHGDDVYCVAFSPDGSRLASGSQDGTVRIWDVMTGKATDRVSANSSMGFVNSVAFDPSGTRVFAAWYHGDGGEIRVWDAAAPGLPVTLPHDSFVECLAFSSDGSRLVTGTSNGDLNVWDVSSRKRLSAFRAHPSGVSAIGFDPTGRRIASGGNDKIVRVWDLASGRQLTEFAGHTETVAAVAFSPTGTEIVSGSRDKTARVWDATSGATLATWQGPAMINAVAYGGRGDVVYLGLGDPSGGSGNTKTAGIWRWRQNRVDPLVNARKESAVLSIALSPDGRSVVMGGSGVNAVIIWDGGLLKETAELSGQAIPEGVAFSPDGRRIATAGWDKTLCIWDPETQERLLTLRAEDALGPLAWSSDGSTLASAAGKAVSLWSARSAYNPDADALVGRLSKELDLADDVMARLRQDDAIDAGLRGAAIELVRSVGDSPGTLNSRAWELAAAPGADPTKRARALRQAEAAVRLAPWEWSYQNTLGVVQYRNGMYREAVATLERARALLGHAAAGDLTFLAMAHQKLGDTAAARDALEKLRTEMKKPANADDEELKGFVREAETLIEGTPPNAPSPKKK